MGENETHTAPTPTPAHTYTSTPTHLHTRAQALTHPTHTNISTECTRFGNRSSAPAATEISSLVAIAQFLPKTIAGYHPRPTPSSHTHTPTHTYTHMHAHPARTSTHLPTQTRLNTPSQIAYTRTLICTNATPSPYPRFTHLVWEQQLLLLQPLDLVPDGQRPLPPQEVVDYRVSVLLQMRHVLLLDHRQPLP